MADSRTIFTHTPAMWLTATATITVRDHHVEHMLRSIQLGPSEFPTSYLEKRQQNGILSETLKILEVLHVGHAFSF